MYRLQIAQDIEAVSNVKDQRELINRSIQHSLERVYQWFDFPYYIQDKGVINTIATYETGTVSVTNGSKTITFSGSTLTSDMGSNRKIRFSDETPFYRIASVNTGAGTAVLEQPYQGSNNTLATFTIYRDEYRLASDVDRYKIIRQLQNGTVLFDTHPTAFDTQFPMPQGYGDPVRSTMVGTKLDTYSTGTISATVNTSIITGVSTAWLSVEGLGRLTRIKSGNNIYTVKSVDSDTQLTVYENFVTAIAPLSTYEIKLNNLIVQLNDIPDSNRLLYYRYFRRPAPLAQDYDTPDMPDDYHWILVWGGLSWAWAQKGDVSNAQTLAEQRFMDGLQSMKLKIGSFAADRIPNRRSVDRIQGSLDGREQSNFDRRYSL